MIVGVVRSSLRRAESDGIVGTLVGSTGPESGAAALVIGVGVRVGAVALCSDVRDVSSAEQGTVLVHSLK